MAKSRTSYEKGHRRGAQPGNQLTVRHGMHSEALVEETMVEISAQLDAELEQVPYLAIPDGTLVRAFKRTSAQAERGWKWIEANGGMFTANGRLKNAARDLLTVQRHQMELAKVVGLGAVPRAQVARDMANAGRDAVEIRAAQERMRARLKVVNEE